MSRFVVRFAIASSIVALAISALPAVADAVPVRPEPPATREHALGRKSPPLRAASSTPLRASALTTPSPYNGGEGLGDTEPFPDPRADITAYAVYYSPTSITLAYKTFVMTDPRVDPVWDCTTDFVCGGSVIQHSLDVNGDGFADFEVFADRSTSGGLEAEVTNESFAHLCNASFDWNAVSGYVVSFYPGCLGGFGPIRVNFFDLIDTNPFGEAANPVVDFAPGQDAWTPFVSMTVPPPPPPPPTPTYAVPARGFVLDGYGGLHGFRTAASAGAMPVATDNAYWRGWDIARGVDTLAGQPAGFVVDGFGGLHPFATGAPATVGAVHGGPYWRGKDIARGVALLRDGTGGFVLDAFGGLHGFSIGANPAPVAAGNSYWPGFDLARGVTMLEDGTGYVVDVAGGIHPFRTNATSAAATRLGPRLPGIARGIAALRDSVAQQGGFVADAYGGLHGFDIGSAGGNAVPRPPTNGPYWPGWNIVRGITVSSE